jgi:hypothetical protein
MAKKRPSKKTPVTKDVQSESATVNETILRVFQQMSELDFTQRVLIPILGRIRSADIQYNGGPGEKGVDCVCWKTDPLTGALELTVIQVKKSKAGAKSKDIDGLPEIVTQLGQAANNPRAHISGQSVLPTETLFVTPFPVNIRSLDACFATYEVLRNRNVKVIDGTRIVELAKIHLPELIDSIVDVSAKVAGILQKEVSNQALMDALDVNTDIHLPSIHTDIDVAIGRQTTKLFLLADMAPATKHIEIDSSTWNGLLTLLQGARKTFGVTLLLDGGIVESERFEDALAKSLEPWQKKLAEQQQTREECVRQLTIAEKPLRKMIRRVQSMIDTNQVSMVQVDPRTTAARVFELASEFGKLVLPQGGLPPEKTWKTVRQWVEEASSNDVFSSASLDPINPKPPNTNMPTAIESLEKGLGLDQLSQILGDWYKAAQRLVQCGKDESAIKEKLESGTLRIRVTGNALSVEINKKRDDLRGVIRDFNKKVPSVIKLREFLSQCQSLFEQTDRLLSHTVIRQILGIHEDKIHLNNEQYRLCLPTSLLFSTGVNLAILGEAGAGKTTALKMYAHELIQKVDRSFPVFIPLVRLAKFLSPSTPTEVSLDDAKFVDSIVAYLRSRGVGISRNELENRLQQKGTVLLFDGVDEAIKEAPHILGLIARIAEQFPNAQVLTSSRVSGTYLNDIPFLGITLLPFTPSQRRSFVTRWFEGKSPQQSNFILTHLDKNPDLAQLVANPLLTTILCVLHENGAPLPDNEVRLYDERMRLLLGHYDQHRDIRRLTTRRDDLRALAEELGFWLHSNNRRYASRESLYHVSKEFLCPRLSPDQATQVCAELIDPCNILVPMTNAGDFGFGHMRYQEFLAACHLKSDRSIDLRSLMESDQWRDALVLFSRMNPSIDWIIRFADVTKFHGRVKKTLDAMIEVRSPKERELHHKEISRLLRSREKLSRKLTDLEADFDRWDGTDPDLGLPDE